MQPTVSQAQPLYVQQQVQQPNQVQYPAGQPQVPQTSYQPQVNPGVYDAIYGWYFFMYERGKYKLVLYSDKTFFHSESEHLENAIFVVSVSM